MKIGMCIGDDSHWNPREIKKLSELEYPKFNSFSIEKDIFGICANSRVDIEESSLLGFRQLHKLSYKVLHKEIHWKVTENNSHEIYTNFINFDAVAMAMGSENL